MISLSMKLKIVRDALTAVSQKVSHYRRPPNLEGWIIWQEDSESGSFKAGNHLAEQQIHGTIDYYTRTEYDQTADDIQAVLDAVSRIGWQLSSVQYEDETGLIHHEWDFWVM